MKENFGVARAESKALTEQLRAEILLKEKALGQLELYAQKDKNRQEILVRKKNDKDKLRNQLEESQKNLNIMQQELSRFVKQEKTDTLFKKKYKDLEVHLFNRDKETLLLKESLVSQKGKLDQLQAYLNIKNKQIKNFQEKFLNLKENYLALEKNGATAQLKKKWDNLVAEQKKLKKQLSKENQEKLALQKKLEIKVLALKAESQKGAQWQGKWEKAMTDLEQVQKEMNPLKGDLKTKSSTLVKVLAERDEWNSKLSEENKKLLIANGMYKELSKANSQLKSKFKKLTSMLTTSEKTNQGLKKKIKEILKKKAN
jgi:chromosome segregation ATPase